MKKLEMLEQAHMEKMLEVFEERRKEFDPSFWGVREKMALRHEKFLSLAYMLCSFS